MKIILPRGDKPNSPCLNAPAVAVKAEKPKKMEEKNTEEKDEKTKAECSTLEEEFLVDQLQDQKNKGNQSDTGFKPQVWKELAVKFRERGDPDSGPVKTSEQIKTKFANVSAASVLQS